MKFILLSDCRCGGNALRSALANHPGLSVAGELLNPRQPNFRQPTDYRSWAICAFSLYDGFHLQRYQIPMNVSDWTDLLFDDLHVISLRRDDTLAQYKSWKLAMASDQWLERDGELPSIEWDQSDYELVRDGWVAGRAFTDALLSQTRVFDLEYEQLNRDFQKVIASVLDFLGCERMNLFPDFTKPARVDYRKVFLSKTPV